MSTRRLAVWGDPIAHSKSPEMHTAAYRVFGRDWEYGRQQVRAADFARTLAELDGSWLGLSLTMPLKEEARKAASSLDAHAELTGAVNTLLLGESSRGFNTDVGGIVDALSENRITEVTRVRLLGAGATAASAAVAARDLGATHLDVRARRPERAAGIVTLGDRLGLTVSVDSLDARATDVDLTIATLPSGTALPPSQTVEIASHGGALFDAAYAPWPSALAAAWSDRPVISGLAMLLHQAVRQIRIFSFGDVTQRLNDEENVTAEMRSALMGD